MKKINFLNLRFETSRSVSSATCVSCWEKLYDGDRLVGQILYDASKDFAYGTFVFDEQSFPLEHRIMINQLVLSTNKYWHVSTRGRTEITEFVYSELKIVFERMNDFIDLVIKSNE